MLGNLRREIISMSKKQQYFDLSNFEQDEFIGKGGFSEVYKIKELNTGLVLAAKISLHRLDRNTKEIKELRTRISREVNIISRLRHPCVLKFLGYSPIDFNQESKPIIITQYYSNGTLENIISLQRQNLAPNSWDDTKKLINIYGIASGVSYLHAHDILHRDLKPQNILEDENLFPKIADFGLAQVSHQKQDCTTYQPNNRTMGTTIYIAPEIWKKNAYSTAGDVYSFSLIVYEIMTKEVPFKGFDQDKIFDEILQNHARPRFKCMIPSSYRRLIERCWNDDPLERPTFDEILTELKTNPGFISRGVVKEDFFDYVEFVDQFHSSHDQNKPILPYEEIKNQRRIKRMEEIKRKQEEKKVVPSSPGQISSQCPNPILKPNQNLILKPITNPIQKPKRAYIKKKTISDQKKLLLSNIQEYLDNSYKI